MTRPIEVIYKRIPAEPGQRKRPCDIIAVMPYEPASYGNLVFVGATFYEDDINGNFGWIGGEISLQRFFQLKPVAEAEVPPSLREYLEWNPEGDPFEIKVRKRLVHDRVRAEAWLPGAGPWPVTG